MSHCMYRKIANKKLLYDLKETYMYENIEVHISPTDDYPDKDNCIVYKTTDYDISRQIAIIEKFLKRSDLFYLKNTLYANVVMSGWSEGDTCDTYIFLVKLEGNVESLAKKMRIRSQGSRF